ncbi:MAG TPA: ABC transporter permease [Methylomirabilota bacterium]|nr:ABC transporter permease [Methylomirabilota bacterium]
MSTALNQLPEALAATTATKGSGSSLRRDTLRNILRQRSAIVGLTILAILFLTAIFAPLIATHDPIISLRDLGETNITRGDPPCIHALGCALDKPEHLFGIDAVIRDEFSRVVYGARISLQIGFITVGFAIVLGSFIGAVAGFFGGWLDNVLMRVMDVVLSFPSLVLAIAIVTVLGPGLINAQLAIGIVSIPIYARVMRASVLSVREADFVTASRALGESSAGILSRRILPNALTPLIVQGTLGIGGAILEVAALSFVGLGAQPPAAEWGSMIALDRSLFFSAPHLIFFPGLAITFTVLGFNLLGDGMRDALDPRLNR